MDKKLFVTSALIASIFFQGCGGNTSQAVLPDSGGRGSEGITQSKTISLSAVYRAISFPDFQPGKTVKYSVEGRDGYNRSTYYEIEMVYLGRDRVTGFRKIQKMIKIRDYNKVIVHLSKQIIHLNEEGQTMRIEYIEGHRAGVNEDAISLGKLPDNVDYTGTASGLLSTLEGNDGGRTKGSWEWIGASRGAAMLRVREEVTWGNSKDYTLVIYETTYYVKSDGDVPTFDLIVDIPGLAYHGVFKGIKEYI